MSADVNRANAVAGRPISREATPGSWPLGGPADQMITHVSGANRSEMKPRYDLIPQCALIRIAARFEMGLKYGEHNYKLGLPFDDTLNHVIDHLLAYKERRKEFQRQTSEGNVSTITLQEFVDYNAPDGDDLAAAAWGVIAMMYLEQKDRLL